MTSWWRARQLRRALADLDVEQQDEQSWAAFRQAKSPDADRIIPLMARRERVIRTR